MCWTITSVNCIFSFTRPSFTLCRSASCTFVVSRSTIRDVVMHHFNAAGEDKKKSRQTAPCSRSIHSSFVLLGPWQSCCLGFPFFQLPDLDGLCSAMKLTSNDQAGVVSGFVLAECSVGTRVGLESKWSVIDSACQRTRSSAHTEGAAFKTDMIYMARLIHAFP